MVEEQARHRLAVKVRELLGDTEGDTLMAMLPPVGWADVATKQDLTHLKDTLRGEIAELRGEMRSEIGKLRGEIGGMRGEIGRAMAKQTITIVSWNGAALLAVAGLAFGDRLLA